MNNIKRMDIKEFREKGFLQEANRLFFHPLGLALEVAVDETTGEEKISSVWDCRDDPEGIFFAEEMIEKENIEHVEKLRLSKVKTRVKVGLNTREIRTDANGVQKERQ